MQNKEKDPNEGKRGECCSQSFQHLLTASVFSSQRQGSLIWKSLACGLLYLKEKIQREKKQTAPRKPGLFLMRLTV